MKVRRTVIEIEAPWATNIDAVLQLIRGALNNAGIPHQAQVIASVKSNNVELPPLIGFVSLEALMSRHNLGRTG
jgi:hypothetical protein